MPPSDGPVVAPFIGFLARHNNGKAADEAAVLLHELTAAVLDTGKKGTLTIKVGLTCLDDATIVAIIDVTSAVPMHPSKSEVYFATGDGNLSREDPNQLQFSPLRDAAVAAALAVHSSDRDDDRDERAERSGLA